MTKAKKVTFKESPVAFQSEGHHLIGVLHYSGQPKILIMCHGFTGNKIENKRLFVEAAREFAAQGFDVLRFDFYGSGDSEGDFAETTLSHNIANLKDAMHWAGERGYGQIGVLGISMGAATAILTLADHPAEVLVTWSAVPDMKKLFDSYGENVEDQSQLDVYEYDGWLIKKTFLEDGLHYDVMKALSTLAMPKFIVQGTGDAPLFIKGFHDFRNVVMPPADFMEIPGAGHTYQTPAHRRQVIRQTVTWLKRHF